MKVDWIMALEGDHMDMHRYAVTLAYPKAVDDGSGPNTRTVHLWATSPAEAKTAAEGWAKRELRVVAHATDAQLARS